ncbi:hypothetical protein AGLY_002008, partial [Aphis glycines]
ALKLFENKVVRRVNNLEVCIDLETFKFKILDIITKILIIFSCKTGDPTEFINHLDSERSDECIDFTMIITSRNNAPISNYGSGFRCKSEYPWCIIEVKSKYFPTVFKKNEKNKKKKNNGKTGIFTQNQFSTESIFLYGCNSKTNHCKYLKFSSNVYISVIYIHVDKIFLAPSKYLKIVYKVPHMHNFLYLKFSLNVNVSVQIFTKSVENVKICNVDKIFLALSKYLKVPHKHNFFSLAFEVQILTKIRQNHEYLQIILELKIH